MKYTEYTDEQIQEIKRQRQDLKRWTESARITQPGTSDVCCGKRAVEAFAFAAADD